MKRVALIGSSGGGTATLGHTCPVSFLRAIDAQLTLVEGKARLAMALFVALDGGKGMDGVDDQSSARLFQLQLVDEKEVRNEVIALGPLGSINQKCAEIQRQVIAREIREHRIDALICVSCHVGIFRETLQAAAQRGDQFPVTGSGGTSVARIGSLYGISLINPGGSVATTTETKAVSYTHGIAKAWGRSYEPWKTHLTESSQSKPSLTSVLNSCLPAFWGVCLTKKLLVALEHAVKSNDAVGAMPLSFVSLTETIESLEHHTLPTVCAVLTALSFRHKEALSSEVSTMMAAIVASSSCADSILAGLWAGYLVSLWSDKCLYTCIFWNFPATMTALVAGGGLGGVISLLVLPVAAILRNCTGLFRHILSAMLQSQPWGVVLAFLLGCLSCYGSKVGWYHSHHLPLILVEMELGDYSFLGAVDELTLVLVCAGICAAIQMRGTEKSSPADVLLCRRGLGVNLACGDFVEVCYPYMDASWLINIGGYLASGFGCSWLIWRRQQVNEGVLPESLAYLPWPAAVAVSSPNHQDMIEASFVAFGIAFLFTLVSFERKP
eukprot:scaffold2418_cov175-Amphora_coffeaeformis.AAC.13